MSQEFGISSDLLRESRLSCNKNVEYHIKMIPINLVVSLLLRVGEVAPPLFCFLWLPVYLVAQIHIDQNGWHLDLLKFVLTSMLISFRLMMNQIQNVQRSQSLQVEKVTNVDACHEVIFLCYILSFILGVYQLIFPLVGNLLCSILSILIITGHNVV